MDLTPGEKAVLGQIRVLYSGAGQRDQPLKALMMQWPPTHHEAYQKSYVGLLAKQLIEPAGTQAFKITDAGLSAIGVAIERPRVQVSGTTERRTFPHMPTDNVAQRQGKTHRSGFGNALLRLVSGLLRAPDLG
jgi:hypothetical protein